MPLHTGDDMPKFEICSIRYPQEFHLLEVVRRYALKKGRKQSEATPLMKR
jgi:hypothetical protein